MSADEIMKLAEPLCLDKDALLAYGRCRAIAEEGEDNGK